MEEKMEKPKKPKKEKSSAEKILSGAEKAGKEPVKMKGGEGKKAHGMSIHKLKSSGYHIHHLDENKLPIQGEEHAVQNGDQLHDHLEQHLEGMEPNEGEEEMAGGAPAPQAQPAPMGV